MEGDAFSLGTDGRETAGNIRSPRSCDLGYLMVPVSDQDRARRMTPREEPSRMRRVLPAPGPAEDRGTYGKRRRALPNRGEGCLKRQRSRGACCLLRQHENARSAPNSTSADHRKARDFRDLRAKSRRIAGAFCARYFCVFCRFFLIFFGFFRAFFSPFSPVSCGFSRIFPSIAGGNGKKNRR